jgi:protein gp37
MTSFWKGSNVNDQRMMERMIDRCEELLTKIRKKKVASIVLSRMWQVLKNLAWNVHGGECGNYLETLLQ